MINVGGSGEEGPEFPLPRPFGPPWSGVVVYHLQGGGGLSIFILWKVLENHFH